MLGAPTTVFIVETKLGKDSPSIEGSGRLTQPEPSEEFGRGFDNASQRLRQYVSSSLVPDQ